MALQGEGFLTLLLMLYVNIRIVTSAPSQPICDSRILERFINQAKEMETMDSSQFPVDIIVPESKLKPAEWNELHMLQKAAEVWRGLSLFSKAIQAVLNFTTDSTLKYKLEITYSNIRSTTHILRSLNLQDETQNSDSKGNTLPIRTYKKFYYVYRDFLRGKCKLLVTEVCRDICIGGSCKP
ncbi:erythropoietin [Discoglossus pictus]